MWKWSGLGKSLKEKENSYNISYFGLNFSLLRAQSYWVIWDWNFRESVRLHKISKMLTCLKK